MVQIQFETEKQAARILEILKKQHVCEEQLSYITYDEDQIISISFAEHNMASIIQLIRDVFLTFIQEDLLPKWLLKIVSDKFFYTEKDECHEIVDIALTIMNENESPYEDFWNELQLKIYYGLVHIFERDVSFSFPSFLAFRMRGVMDRLIEFVGDAIDEYKMEQEYQSFVYALRNYMLSITPKVKQLHVLHQYYFHFYTEKFTKIDRVKLRKYIDRNLHKNYPMYIDSSVLAPLVSIAPNHLFIYSDEDNHPLILTIQRIFEERVKVLPHKMFKTNQLLATVKK